MVEKLKKIRPTMNSNNILERWDRLFHIRGCRMLNDTRKSNNSAKKGENACAPVGIVMAQTETE